MYEATIESIDDEKVTVRFIGYDNSDTVLADELLESKGQEWRELQVEVSLNKGIGGKGYKNQRKVSYFLKGFNNLHFNLFL